MHASCESPWYLSAKHHVLEACFLLMVPFRTRFSPCEMVRTANVQRLRGCLYTLRYCYILTCRLVTAQLLLPIDLSIPGGASRVRTNETQARYFRWRVSVCPFRSLRLPNVDTG